MTNMWIAENHREASGFSFCVWCGPLQAELLSRLDEKCRVELSCAINKNLSCANRIPTFLMAEGFQRTEDSIEPTGIFDRMFPSFQWVSLLQ